MNDFFEHLKQMGAWYVSWVGEKPKELVINPDIIGKLSRIAGFYQRPELATQVDMHAPVIRNLDLGFGVVTIYEDYTEKFFHFD